MGNNNIGSLQNRNFIDLFSGCGGFSLGLGQAGWTGLFAVEKDCLAFDTFRYNLLEGKFCHYSWPTWLPQKAVSVQNILKKHTDELMALRGKVDLLAGGPPCQGFSMAGQRNSRDPRNSLSNYYMRIVSMVRPKLLIIENVRGFNIVFSNGCNSKRKAAYSAKVKARLEKIGYKVYDAYIKCERFGVPQSRTRFLMIGVLNEIASSKNKTPFELLEEERADFLARKGLPNRPIAAKEAISDLETSRDGARLVKHSGPGRHCFYQVDYTAPDVLTPYQELMRTGLNDEKPNSMRLARHETSTVEKFRIIQSLCSPGRNLCKADKEKLGIRKQAIYVLDPSKPSNTLTTLPDDLLHYSEPRILTVRESARIQSFPDSFSFKGKYTTGGSMRTKECPRYTQVGNAVPPLLAEALGLALKKYLGN